MIIDVHAHAIGEELAIEMSKNSWFGLRLEPLTAGGYAHPNYGPLDPRLFDLESRLDSLDRRGIDLQLISPPTSIFLDHSQAGSIEPSRRINEYTAKLVEEGNGRLGGLAVPCLADPAKIPDELRLAIELHGFKGVALNTHAAGRFLDEPDFEPMFATLEELGLLTFMHPSPNISHASLQDYTLHTTLAFPTETTIAAARLIYAGIFERYPSLNLILAHGGGTLPYLRDRINLGYNASTYEHNPDCHKHISKPPGDYFKQIYYDSLLAGSASLQFLIGLVGANRVVFGTDYPFEVGDPEGKLAMPAIESLPEPDRGNILGGNASDVLATAGIQN